MERIQFKVLKMLICIVLLNILLAKMQLKECHNKNKMANTTQVNISNLFNNLVLLEPRLFFYHWGYRSDILKNIDNNHDQNNIKGRQFPALQWAVPEFTQYIDTPNFQGVKEEIEITLYFDNLQDYSNDGSKVTKNLIEQFADLKQIAEDYIANFNLAFCDKYRAGSITNPKFEQFAYGHNDRLISWRVTFTLQHLTPCTDLANQVDLSLLPLTLGDIDLENWKA